MLELTIASVGLMCILKYGSILAWLRRPAMATRFGAELFGCSLCQGFWSGTLIAICEWSLEGRVQPYLPLVAAASAWLFDAVIGSLHALELLAEDRG